jgi:hypothetical protein
MLSRCFASLLVFLAAASLWGADAGAPQTLRYAILSSGRVAGSEVETYSAGGKIDTTFEFNDRGRGPKLAVHYVIGADGLPVRIDTTGNDYLKAPVDEHFAFDGGRTHWKSTTEEGQSATPGFYVSNNEFPPTTERALLAAALLKSNGAPVKLLPAGEVRLEQLADVTLEDHGQRIHVTDFAITGLAFEPLTVWLDDDRQLFASPGKWAILREGWEGSNDRLYGLDQKAQDERYSRLAHELAHHPAHPVAVEHVRLFDSEHATILEDQTVVVSGERIAMAGPAATVQVPQDAEHIDGTGKTLLPGLFDMHVHASARDGLLHIASGVTSVRDMGNDIDDLSHLQQQWDSGAAIGPRMWKAGLIDGRDKLQAPAGIFVDTPAEAEAAVNRYAGLGYIQIKLYSSLKPELVPGIVKAAHARGLRVSGHVPNGMIASQFVEEGADEIQHINFIFLNFLASKVKDTRTPERFTAVAANAAKLDLHSKEVDDFIDLLKTHHTTVDVTLATFEGDFNGRPGQVSPDFAPVLSRLPAQIQRAAHARGLPVTKQNDQLYKARVASSRYVYPCRPSS